MIRLPWILLFGRACSLALVLLLALYGDSTSAQAPQTRQQALIALSHADPAQRLAAMLRLADIGTAEDAQAVLPRLADRDAAVRRVALPAIWRTAAVS